MNPIDRIGSWVVIVGVLAAVVAGPSVGLDVPTEIAGLPILLIGRLFGRWEESRK